MKTNKSKFQSTFFIFLLFFASINLSAQEGTTKEKLNFKLGYSRYTDTEFFFDNFFKDNGPYGKTPVGNIRLSANFAINKYIDAGLYFGYSVYNTYIEFPSDSNGNGGGRAYNAAHSIMYGLNSNIHILPFFIKKEKFRFDVYCSLQYGGVYLFEPEGYINTKVSYSEYGIYGGLAFYPFRHLGFYAEYGYAKYANLRYGLSFKF